MGGLPSQNKSPQANSNTSPTKKEDDLNLLGIDFNVGDNVKVDMDDDDFFDMLANRKDF